MIIRREARFLLAGVIICGALAGCGSRDSEETQENRTEKVEQVKNMTDTEQPGEADNGADSPPGDDKLSSDRIIMDQTFEVELEGIGEVIFTAYAPETDQNPQADAVFALLNTDGTLRQVLDGMCEDDIRAAAECFESVEAVSFADYNGDDRKDVITIASYSYVQGPDAGGGFSEARVYWNTGDKLVLEREISQNLLFLF